MTTPRWNDLAERLGAAASAEALRLIERAAAIGPEADAAGGASTSTSAPRSESSVADAATRARYREGVAVSVIVPCFNDGRFILDAVASVDAADASYELIVVDDGSDDRLTLDALALLRHLGYFVVAQENRGVARARNTAIQAAHGRYILPLDADDRLFGAYLSRGADVLDHHPTVGVVYTDFEAFGHLNGAYRPGPFDVDRLATHNFLGISSMFRRAAWEACGGFDEDLPHKASWEDHDFWLSLAERGWGFHYLAEVMFAKRERTDSWSRPTRRPEELEYRWRYLVTKHARLYQKPFPESLVAALVTAGRERLVAQQLNDRVFELSRDVNWLHDEVRTRDEQVRWLHDEVQIRDEQIRWLHEEVGRRDQRIAALEQGGGLTSPPSDA